MLEMPKASTTWALMLVYLRVETMKPTRTNFLKPFKGVIMASNNPPNPFWSYPSVHSGIAIAPT